MSNNISIRSLFIMCGLFVLLVTLGLSVYAGKLFLNEVDDLAEKNTLQRDSNEIARLATSYIFVNKHLSAAQKTQKTNEMEMTGIVALFATDGSAVWVSETTESKIVSTVPRTHVLETVRMKSNYISSVPLILDAEISRLQEYADINFSDSINTNASDEPIGHAILKKPVQRSLSRNIINRYLLVGSVIMTSMVILLSIIIYRMIGKPLTLLRSGIVADNVDVIEQGLFDNKISTIEIVSLVNAYLTQHRSITSAKETLEDKVNLRTQELGELTEKLRILAFRVEQDNQSITRRIAAEIHDDLCSLQIALKRRMEKYLNRIDRTGNPVELSTEIKQWIEMTDQADAVARSIIDKTQTKITSYLGIAAGIEDAMRHNLDDSDVDSYFINRSTRIEELDPVMNEDIVKIVSEATRNAVLHSEATRITVSVDDEDECAVIRISDNGKGFDRTALKRSYGIQIMEERAVHIQAILFFSQREKGTEVVLTVPFKQISFDSIS